MGHRPADFDQYWQDTLDTLAGYPACPEIDALPLRTTDFATLYGVRLTSLGPYRVFGYLSVPVGPGPFPAIYYAPKYQSVHEIIPQGTANAQRSRYVTFSLAVRGDVPGAAHRGHRGRPGLRLPRRRGGRPARPRVPARPARGGPRARGRGRQRRGADHRGAGARRDAR